MKYFPYNSKKGLNFYRFPIVLPNKKILTKIIIEEQEVPVHNTREELFKLSKIIDLKTENYYKYITLYDKEINVVYT